jgi:hypothetical protein
MFGVLTPFLIWHWTCRWVTAPSIIKLTQLLTVKIQTSRRIGTDLLDTKRLWIKDKPINATQDPLPTIKLRPFKSGRRSTTIYYYLINSPEKSPFVHPVGKIAADGGGSRPFCGKRKIVDCIWMKARGDPCRVGIIASLDIGSDHLLDMLSTKGFWRHGSFPCRVGNPVNLRRPLPRGKPEDIDLAAIKTDLELAVQRADWPKMDRQPAIA